MTKIGNDAGPAGTTAGQGPSPIPAAPIPTHPIPALSSSAPPSPIAHRLQKPLFILFLLAFAVNEALLILRIDPVGGGRWVEGALLILAAASALGSLAQRLPLQNALAAGVILYCLAALLLLLASVTAVPFGPFVHADRLGARLFGVLPWTVPLLWVVIVVNGRGVARLMMRPWRKTNFYGYWVIGLTGGMAVLFDLSLEPFATLEKRYWLWTPTLTSLAWHGTPWVNFLGWFVAVGAMVAVTLPWLVNKQPVKRPMDYLPLLQWLALQTWMITGNGLNGLWLAVLAGLIGNAVVTVFAVRGARW